MTYLENGYLTFGYEFEGTGITLQQAQQIARDNNWKHIIVKRDGTHGVDFEINFPNYPLCIEAYEEINYRSYWFNRICSFKKYTKKWWKNSFSGKK